MGCGTRIAGALLAVLLLIAVPVMAAAVEGPQVPPTGTVVILFGLSDGTTILPVGQAMAAPGVFCDVGP